MNVSPLVQSTGSASSGSVANLAIPLPNNVKAGNVIFVSIACNNDSFTTGGSVSDNLGNSYIRMWIVNAVGAGRAESVLYVGMVSVGGSCTITVDPNGSDFVTAGIAEFTSMSTPASNPFGSNDTGNGGEYNGDVPPYATATQATKRNNEIVVGSTEHNGADTTITPDSPAIEIYKSTNTVGSMPIEMAYYISTTPGAKNMSWTYGANRPVTAISWLFHILDQQIPNTKSTRPAPFKPGWGR